MNKTKIEWCDSTWNPVTGCLHGCEYCCARYTSEKVSGHWDENKLKTVGGNGSIHVIDEPMSRHTNGKNRDVGVHSDIAPYPFGFDPTFHKYRLNVPQKRNEPQTILVCSTADLFGEWIPDEWIEAVFEACKKAPQHRYLFLTKNSKRYTELANNGKLPQLDNMWYGTSITGKSMKYFFSYGTYNTFISIEPLLEPLNVGVGSFSSTKWIIIGAETGNRKNKVMPQKEWIDNICEAANLTQAAVFMKDSLIPIVGKENMRREFPWR